MYFCHRPQQNCSRCILNGHREADDLLLLARRAFRTLFFIAGRIALFFGVPVRISTICKRILPLKIQEDCFSSLTS